MKIDSERLFGIPFSICNIDPESYNKEEIISDITYNYSKSPIRNKGPIAGKDDNVHHAYSDWENPQYIKSNYNELSGIYTKLIPECLKKFDLNNFNFSFDIVNYSCMSEGSYMTMHDHCKVDFVSLHYIQFDPTTHIQTEYVNEQPFSLYQKVFTRPNKIGEIIDKNVSTSMYSESWRLPVEEDSFHIVPGFLSHRVPVQPKCDKLRIVVIANINVEGQ
tara:strand:- start:294 stop:950 length:657 start_codon:yes stop_codon:yes gene_type:complete